MRLSERAERLVEAQWALVRSYQAVDEGVAGVLYRHELDRERERARSSVEPLLPWASLPRKVEKSFRKGPDLARLRRILDVVQTGDRILEIGTGTGYMSGVLLRDRVPVHYCGVDISPRLIESVHAMAERNDIDMTSHDLVVRDLFDLTPEFFEHHDPDVVLLLEVVEHVRDPALALRLVADALSADAVLVFSVPLLGRIEACWGHVSLFDDRRVRALCEQAGLLVQNVEVVQNHWLLVIAARTEIPAERLAGLRVAAEGEVSDAKDTADYELRRLPLAAGAEGVELWSGVPAARSVEMIDAPVGVAARVVGGQGGLALPTPAAGVVRLEIGFGDERDLEIVTVDQLDNDGRVLSRWTWNVAGVDLPDRFITVIFRPGVPTRMFKPLGFRRAGVVATTVIAVRTSRKATASFTVRRAAVGGAAGALPVAEEVRSIGTDRVGRELYEHTGRVLSWTRSGRGPRLSVRRR